MKKILLLLVVFIIAAPPVAWKIEKVRQIKVVVVDQSVSSGKSETHAGIVWLLDNMKIHGEAGRSLALEDYFGFFPTRSERVRRFTYDDLAGKDLVYLADTRGVWRSGLESFEILRDRDRDEIIHSGMSLNEVRALTDFVRNGGPVFAEGFFFYARHEGGDATRKRLEDLFGVRWSGWIGGWFKDLNSLETVPFWVRGMYERTQLQQWPYRGPGVMFVKPATGEFVVLSPGIELRSPRPEVVITQRRGILESGIETNVPFSGWFEVVDPITPDMILASLRVQLTGAGELRMREVGLPSSFPLLAAQWVDSTTWYLAGDMGTIEGWLGPAKLKWMPDLRASAAAVLESQLPGERAFWTFYIPLLRNLLDTYAR